MCWKVFSAYHFPSLFYLREMPLFRGISIPLPFSVLFFYRGLMSVLGHGKQGCLMNMYNRDDIFIIAECGQDAHLWPIM